MKTRIYTSSVREMNELVRNHIVPVTICRWPGKFNCENMIELSPTGNLLSRYKSGNASREQYIVEFKEMLKNRDAKQIMNKLEMIAQSANANGVALVCYEPYGEFCHRHLVAEWLEEQLGILVDEFDAGRARQLNETIAKQAWQGLSQSWLEMMESEYPERYNKVMNPQQ